LRRILDGIVGSDNPVTRITTMYEPVQVDPAAATFTAGTEIVPKNGVR
jgi:hypothetical protein